VVKGRARSQQLGASSFLCQRSPSRAHFHPKGNVELYHLFAIMSREKVEERLFMAAKGCLRDPFLAPQAVAQRSGAT
jgi:hypothetical protein